MVEPHKYSKLEAIHTFHSLHCLTANVKREREVGGSRQSSIFQFPPLGDLYPALESQFDAFPKISPPSPLQNLNRSKFARGAQKRRAFFTAAAATASVVLKAEVLRARPTASMAAATAAAAAGPAFFKEFRWLVLSADICIFCVCEREEWLGVKSRKSVTPLVDCKKR